VEVEAGYGPGFIGLSRLEEELSTLLNERGLDSHRGTLHGTVGLIWLPGMFE
jgi:hypothetical protein